MKLVPAILISSITVAAGLALSYALDRSEFERQLSIQTDELRKDVDLLAGRLEQSLNHQLQLTRGLAAFVKSNPYFNEKDFDAFADALVDGQKGIRSLQLAPEAVVRFITNKKDNIKALGHDLLADPKRRPRAERAIRERKYVIAGPIDLIQGGKAIIARLPVFLPDQTSDEDFWGFATILIDPIALIGDAGISDGLPGIELALRGKDGLGKEGAIIYGAPAVFDKPLVEIPVTLPSGSWLLAASAGTAAGSAKWTFQPSWMFHFGSILSLIVGLAAFSSLRRPEKLREKIDEATVDLEKKTIELSILAENEAALRVVAERAEKSKSKFLASMSHEIRTPLGGMIGLTDLILEDPSSPRTAEYARRLKEAGRHLLNVVNDILDFSKVTAGRVELVQAPFRLDDLSEAVEGAFGPAAAQKGIALEIDVSPDAAIEGDEFRLRQVVFNLIGNALKATEAGAVTFRLRLTDENSAPGLETTLCVEVKDTGSGMSPDVLQKIFEPYVQERTTRSQGGTGLGLAISRDLVRIMGGEIGVVSQIGEGSLFSFSIPVVTATIAEKAPSPTEAEDESAANESALKVLVADDIELNRMLVEMALHKMGHSVVLAHGGSEALDLARAQQFDAFVLDIQMPGMDGVEVMTTIKNEGLDRGGRLIALTADVVHENVESYLAAGFDACLSKPTDWTALGRALHRQD